MGFDEITKIHISARVVGQHRNSTGTINLPNDSFSPGKQVFLRTSLDDYFEILLLEPESRKI